MSTVNVLLVSFLVGSLFSSFASGQSVALRDSVPILANKIELNADGRPTKLIFDPNLYGGVEVSINDMNWPANCKFGGINSIADDLQLLRLQKTAEASTDRLVDRIGVCEFEMDYPVALGLRDESGLVTTAWESLWGEKGNVVVWYRISQQQLTLFSFRKHHD